MLARIGKAAMVVAHPNHELFYGGIIQRTQPDILFLTHSNADSVARGKAAVASLNHQGRIDFLDVSEKDVYDRLLSGDFGYFRKLQKQVARWLHGTNADTVFTDQFEWYNPVHDLGVLLVDSALATDCRNEKSCRRFDLPIALHTIPEAQSHTYLAKHHEVLYFHLRENELDRKRAAMRDSNCAATEVLEITSGWTDERFTFEIYAPTPWNRDFASPPAEEAWQTYDAFGSERVRQGVFKSPILLQEHFAPLAKYLLPRAYEIRSSEAFAA